jgi:hypothetical protein
LVTAAADVSTLTADVCVISPVVKVTTVFSAFVEAGYVPELLVGYVPELLAGDAPELLVVEADG